MRGNERRMVVPPRPLDRFPLRLEGGEYVVRVIFDDEVLDCAAFRAAPGMGFDVDIRHLSLPAVRQWRHIPHVQYHRLAACNLDRVSRPARHDGPGEGRNIGNNGAVRRIGFVLAHDPEGLFAAIIAAQRDRGAEGGRVPLCRRPDDFRACAPGPPSGPRALRIVACDRRCAFSKRARAASIAPRGHQIAMRGDRPVGEIRPCRRLA